MLSTIMLCSYGPTRGDFLTLCLPAIALCLPALKEKVGELQLRKLSYLNARYRSYSSTEQSCIGGRQRITMFLHEKITCRLEFPLFWDSNINIFCLIQNSNTFRKIQKWRHVYGDENPRCRSQLLNLTNEPHSVLDRTFVSAIGHRKRINIDEDSISFF